jgi:hypothetical protein
MREFGQIPAIWFAAKVIYTKSEGEAVTSGELAIIAIELASFFGTESSAEISPACKEHVTKL